MSKESFAMGLFHNSIKIGLSTDEEVILIFFSKFPQLFFFFF